ncbi:MAG: hypothetical protein ABF679_01905 [Lentilactobacillus diolivorans]|jgi:hypothetical protein|uniref:Methanol dehydrogenase n=1 Tax=Lentilactobacillus diolivorans TaxID=179838 RepID=A0ABQ0XDK1_9LACO|nr:hypothetical protein [Lentilactobacillus diolivorans]MDH5106817.1 hypothetical protein [Lentilactobacillus diolivorans]GEP23744.1 hypothetical protein LDI01_13370 [Lentilactobacillus diolivorans]
MKHKKLVVTGVGVIMLGVYFLKSIGWFENDAHLYDQFEDSDNR